MYDDDYYAQHAAMMEADKKLNVGEGFVAGTRVHTPEGLRRISELKVGDLVFARETIDSANVVKKIINTGKQSKRRLLVNKYALENPYRRPLSTQYPLTSARQQYLWLVNAGWVMSEQIWLEVGKFNEETKIQVGQELMLLDGRVCWWQKESQTYATANDFLYVPDREDVGEGGYLLDPMTDSFGEETAFDWEHWTDDGNSAKLAHVDTYTLQVEDFNTYFVGEHGIWVKGAE